jgi:5-methylcytosine-specific restriction endonuclease McrA
MRAYRVACPVCEACGEERATETHHIVSEKTGGPVKEWNLLALCFRCHVPGFHTLGWRGACERWPHLAGKVIAARERMGRRT